MRRRDGPTIMRTVDQRCQLAPPNSPMSCSLIVEADSVLACHGAPIAAVQDADQPAEQVQIGLGVRLLDARVEFRYAARTRREQCLQASVK
jgi:hypothetical protein